MPLVFIKDIDAHSKIAVWSITEELEEFENNPHLSAFIHESKGFKSISRRKEWLAVRLLLHHLLQLPFNLSYSSSGKPSLNLSNYSISISHTIGFAAVVLSTKKHVSIDLEVFSERVLRISKRFIREDEQFYSASNEVNTKLLIWCAKELMFKLIDSKGVDFKQHLRVLPFELNSFSGSFHALQFKDLDNFCYPILVNFLITEDFVLVYSILD